MDRRLFLHAVTAAAALPLLSGDASAETTLRPAPSRRRYHAPAVEARVQQVKRAIRDPRLAATFEVCFTDTVDKAVKVGTLDGRPDTFLITGDIDAMWLRDSTAQVYPYLPLARHDEALRHMLRGLICRQTGCVLIDPYANAFTFDPHTSTPHADDRTEMKPGVFERKYELDSLCYVLRLNHGYWKATGDAEPFDRRWREAMDLLVETMRVQQRRSGPGPYRFERRTSRVAETLWEGIGFPYRPCGLISTAFRPSDDAGVYGFLVPANFFAAHELRGLAEMQRALHGDEGAARKAERLAAEVEAALAAHARVQHARHGRVFAFEVDGYGNAIVMDDANIPSLLAMPYLGCVSLDDADYQRTRRLLLSDDNPYYRAGSAARGIGSIHTPRGWIWPLSLVVQALTSRDDAEIAACLRTLVATTAGTSQIHEAFDPNDPSRFSRAWFGWANMLFAELVCRVHDTRPHLLG